MNKEKIGKVLMLVLAVSLVVISGIGMIYCIGNIYLNHTMVWVGVLGTGICLALSTTMLLSLGDWLRKDSIGNTNTIIEEVEE